MYLYNQAGQFLTASLQRRFLNSCFDQGLGGSAQQQQQQQQQQQAPCNYGHSRGDDFDPDPQTVARLLAGISVVGWLVFGVILALCINGRGRGGKWLPDWYVDSRRLREDKIKMGAWWAGMVLLWPVVLPGMAIRRFCVEPLMARWRRAEAAMRVRVEGAKAMGEV